MAEGVLKKGSFLDWFINIFVKLINLERSGDPVTREKNV